MTRAEPGECQTESACGIIVNHFAVLGTKMQLNLHSASWVLHYPETHAHICSVCGVLTSHGDLLKFFILHSFNYLDLPLEISGISHLLCNFRHFFLYCLSL